MLTMIRNSTPLFHAGQQVWFIGGTGTVKSYRPDAGSWTYQVEMEMGPEPVMGRVGYETTVMLSETDIALAEESSLRKDWAIA